MIDVPKELEEAVTLLVKIYVDTKNKAFIIDRENYALYHTWKQIDAKRRKSNAKT